MEFFNPTSTPKVELLRLGESAKSQYDWPQAFIIWEEYRRQYPFDSVGHAKGIKALIELGKLDEAEKVLFETLPRFPDDPDIAMCVGEIPMRRYQWSNAIQDWIEFRKKFPHHPTGFICGIISLRQSGKLEDAAMLLSEVLELFPNEPGVVAQAGEQAMHRQLWHDAIPIWEDLRNRYPNYPTGYTQGINAFIQSGQKEAAESLLEKAFSLFPHDIGIAGQAGELAMRRKEWPEAIQIWKDIRNLFPNHPTGYTRGMNALSQAGQLDAAESLLEKALNLFPRDIGIAAQAGELAMRRRQWRNAINTWAVVRQKFTHHPVGYVGGIEALLQKNEYKKAERVLKAGVYKKIDLKDSYDKINNLYCEAYDWISALRLMVNCDTNIQFKHGWRSKITRALDSLNHWLPTSKESYTSFSAKNHAMNLIIQIRRWIDWTREHTLEKLHFFIENCNNRPFTKPSSILAEIICNNNHVYLRGGTIKYTDEDDLLILIQELLKNESYWFESIENSPLIIDCGTHFGLSLYYFKYLYPQAKIIAFEPNPQLFELAKLNILQNNWTNINLMPLAVSSKTGTRKFHIPRNGTTLAGSLLNRMSAFGFELETIDVQSLQLSEVIEGKVDFLKLDVEGAEYEVIEDIKNRLSAIQNIFCEFHKSEGVESRDLVNSMKLLDRAGFELRINVSSNYNSLLKYKPLSNLDQRSSSELWGTRLK